MESPDTLDPSPLLQAPEVVAMTPILMFPLLPHVPVTLPYLPLILGPNRRKQILVVLLEVEELELVELL